MTTMTLTEIDQQTHLAVAAYHAGDKTTARQLCQSVLDVSPDHPYALNLLGVMTMEEGRLPEAKRLLERVTQAHPTVSNAMNNLGVCLQRMGQLEAAIECLDAALQAQPDDAQARSNLNSMLVARHAEESDESYALRLVARSRVDAGFRFADHWLQLAVLFYQTGRIQQAVLLYREALDMQMASANIYGNLGAHLQDLGDWGGAEGAYQQALALEPAHVGTLYNLGHLLSLQHRHSEAQSFLKQAIALNPDYLDAHICLGTLLAQAGQLDAAMASFATAKAIDPNYRFTAPALLFNLAYMPSTTAKDMMLLAQEVCRLLPNNSNNSTLNQPLTNIRPTHDKNQWPGDIIRVGFVSGDFKDHPVGYFTENLLANVRRERFEWHIFSNFEAQDHIAPQIKRHATSWSSIAGLGDEVALGMIRDKAIDVLIDLSGHTALHRLPLFARRAAPVQISWLGWHDTTGLPSMDYLLTDRASIPPGCVQTNGQPYITELPLYLPRTRLCMMPPSHAPAVTALPAMANGYITFGSMQVLAKLSDKSLALWRCILLAVPTARLVIRTKQFKDDDILQNFHSKAMAQGLPMERVSLLPPLGRGDYLAAFADIDVLLDSYPYPGGTTTAEALWMGVPTLTMGGSTMISRQGVSLLTAAGLLDWIAKDDGDYIAKAVYWAGHCCELAAQRAALRDHVAGTPLFDGAQFARDFEAAVVSAHDGQNPSSS